MIRNIFFLWSLFLLLIVMPARAVEFDHESHLRIAETELCLDVENIEFCSVCTTCHKPGIDKDIKPNKKVCFQCHEKDFIDEVTFLGLKTHGPTWALDHRPYAKNENLDCSNCHQQADCLECHKAGFADEMGEFTNNMVNVHRSDFHVTHPIAARSDPQLCKSCHDEPKFCSDCHNDFAPADLAILSHRRGFRDDTLGGAHAFFNVNQCQGCHVDSVLPSHDWSNSHAREARKNLTTCQACHPEGDVCMTCHSAVSGLRVNPHPDKWGDIKDRLNNASGGRTCRKCH